MTVTSVIKDPEAMTLAIVADFDAPPTRVWRVWADPRELERWWGPPTYPATFVDHDLSVGARCTYLMTGPGEYQPHGWWRIRSVNPPHDLEFENGFAHDNFAPDDTMPVSIIRVTLDERVNGGTVMTITTSFASAQAMDRLISMGMAEGMSAAMGQIDDVVAETATS
ncbi:MAG: SRPBCC family protein [Acidimicrobiales bacterium]